MNSLILTDEQVQKIGKTKMPLTIPPELKKITPYVRRAEELDKDKTSPESRLVSYYCRQYAVHTGIALATSPTGKSCLGELLGNLESEKAAMDSFTRDESKFLCAKFAEKVFDKADNEDRSGSANKNTAKTFYAAASFLEILQQFYNDADTSEEITEQKKKSVYSKWKATEILKALKQGKKPIPGGYGENDNGAEGCSGEREKNDEENKASQIHNPTTFAVETVNEHSDGEDSKEVVQPTVPSSQLEDDDDVSDEGTEVQLGPPPAYPADENIETVELTILPPAPSMPPPPSITNIPRPPMTFMPPPVAPPSIDDLPPPVPKGFPTPTPSAKKKSSSSSFLGGLIGSNKQKSKRIGKAEIADATELTRFALSALEDKDADLAAERLQQALQCLGR